MSDDLVNVLAVNMMRFGVNDKHIAREIALHCISLVQSAQSVEPVAMRYDFDGYGWQYIDNGSGSNWRNRIKGAEPVYAHPISTLMPLSRDEATKLCKVGGAVHGEPNGLLVFYPQQYRDQLTAARIAGLRIGEAAHGIKATAS
jgi:hypothetical protein